jgi:molybdopterin molybdotransferase
MFSVEEASAAILQRAEIRAATRRGIVEACGLVLAEDITSDVDSPPHDKAMVDGYALIATDLGGEVTHLRVLEEVTAGSIPTKTVLSGTAIRIMTGAPIPEGANAVVMVEQTRCTNHSGQETVSIETTSLAAGANILPRATSLQKYDTVLTSGHLLRPMEIGLLAEVGRAEVDVVPAPSVAVLATGDELVPACESPDDGQIRNSNGPLLQALVTRAGGIPQDLGIARDQPAALREKIKLGLGEDILLLSGGVSAGVLDLVPAALAAAGVEQVFHKVQLKPGKPMWFGCLIENHHPRLVFGLPGNPVSSLVCFELFVRPAIARMSGRPECQPHHRTGILARGHRQRGNRPTYFPSILSEGGDRLTVSPIDWRGSADQRSLVTANGLALFPAGDHDYAAGDTVLTIPL